MFSHEVQPLWFKTKQNFTTYFEPIGSVTFACDSGHNTERRDSFEIGVLTFPANPKNIGCGDNIKENTFESGKLTVHQTVR